MTFCLTGRKAGLEREHAKTTKFKQDECFSLQQWSLSISPKVHPLLHKACIHTNGLDENPSARALNELGEERALCKLEFDATDEDRRFLTVAIDGLDLASHRLSNFALKPCAVLGRRRCSGMSGDLYSRCENPPWLNILSPSDCGGRLATKAPFVTRCSTGISIPSNVSSLV